MTLPPYTPVDDPNTDSVTTRGRNWFLEGTSPIGDGWTIEYGQTHEQQYQPNAFFVVVYVHLEECIGIRMNELAEQKIKAEEEKLVELLEDNTDVRVFIHTPLVIEDQGHWSMFHCSMSIIADRQRVIKSKTGYSLEPLPY
jgi:hypothetical protein